MKEKITCFLKKSGFLPINTKKWQSFSINHCKPANKERGKIKTFISDAVGDSSGIYIYKNNFGKILYVGKGNPLKNRLYSHYRESFEKVPGDTADNLWHKFFSSHKGELMVYWQQVKSEDERKILERMLEYVLNPRFSSFRRRIKTKR
jgi:excinuclease UvrABC nuclease subunit